MATLSVQNISLSGLAPSFAAVAAGGDEVPNVGGDVYVEIINSHASNAYTVTATTPATLQGVAVSDPSITVAAGAGTRRKFGPFPPAVFNTSDQRVALSYSGSAPATDLTIGAFRLPR